MKKRFLLIIAVFALVLFSYQKGQAQFGIKGGIYTTSFSELDKYDLKNNIGFQAGIAYKLNLLPMFTIQPELLYVQKNAKIEDNSGLLNAEKFNLHLIQLPVSFQFGINLMVVRPYLQVVPYINYAISGDFAGEHKWNDVNRFNGGIGLGGGVDLWKLQLNIRYNWDFKKVGGKDSTDPMYERYKISKGRALEISLGLFF